MCGCRHIPHSPESPRRDLEVGGPRDSSGIRGTSCGSIPNLEDTGVVLYVQLYSEFTTQIRNPFVFIRRDNVRVEGIT